MTWYLYKKKDRGVVISFIYYSLKNIYSMMTRQAFCAHLVGKWDQSDGCNLYKEISSVNNWVVHP
jgi:hypothetical protein